MSQWNSLNHQTSPNLNDLIDIQKFIYFIFFAQKNKMLVIGSDKLH